MTPSLIASLLPRLMTWLDPTLATRLTRPDPQLSQPDPQHSLVPAQMDVLTDTPVLTVPLDLRLSGTHV